MHLARIAPVVLVTLLAAMPAGAAPADTCLLEPATLDFTAGRFTTTYPNRGTGEFAASMSTTLDCPEGHPLDGAGATLDEYAHFIAFACLDPDSASEGAVRGRSAIRLEIGERMGDFEGRLEGMITGPDPSGDCLIDATVDARAARGSRISLRLTVSINPRDGTFTGLLTAGSSFTPDPAR